MFFFFNDTAPTEIYPLSLHDALPIFRAQCYPKQLNEPPKPPPACSRPPPGATAPQSATAPPGSSTPDRKSTRLNSSHANISYAVFCLKKKNLFFTKA